MLDHIRAAARALARRPGLTVAVVSTLTLGIGANSAIFSAVDAVLLKPLPYPDADRLVSVYESNLARRQATQLVAPVRLEEWNRMNRTFSGLAASYFENVTDTSGPLPERVAAMRVSPRFFSVLGVGAAAGRTFNPDEERFGGPPVIVLSDPFWRKRFNADPSAIGRSLTLGGASRTIVGVMPPSFRYPSATTEVWMPTQAPAVLMQARQARFYTTVGRLKAGVTPDQGQADLAAAQAQLGKQFPQTDAGWSALVVPLKEEQIGGVRRSLWLLLGAVALVLLAACGNIACLMLADAARREREIAVRFALGASRARIVGHLLAEGMILAGGGAALGLLLARWGIDLLRTAGSALPRIDDLHVDARVVGFTLALGAATTIAFALAPALQATRGEVAARLAHGGRGRIGGRQGIQRVLVGSQIALAIVLLAGAGLLLRSFSRLAQTAPGFDPAQVITFRMSAQWTERTDAVMSRQARTLARLTAIPGVVSAAFSQILPAALDLPPGEFTIVGRATGDRLYATARSVSAGYFRTLHIPLLQGDTCRDDPAKPYRTALVTRAFANQFFPGESPIGQAIEFSSTAGIRQEIVGVVGDVRESGLAKDPPALAYVCGLQPYWPDSYFLVRTERGRNVTAGTMRDALREIEPNRAMYDVRPLADAIAGTMAQQRLSTILLSLFAAAALMLAAIGLHGTLSQFVSQRRREIGLRMALGAQSWRVLAQVAAHGAGVTLIGIALGLAGALALARLMATLIFGISIRDPLTFAVVPIVLAVIAAAATVLPARRAIGVDPNEVLREE